MKWTSRISRRPDLDQAIDELLVDLETALGGPADLLLAFVSPGLSADPARISAALRRTCPQATLVGCTAAGVAGGGQEVESGPAFALMAARLPDVEMQVLALGPHGDLPLSASPQDIAAVVRARPEHQPTVVVLADPFTVEAQSLAAVLDLALPDCVKLGALASGASRPGGHTLWAGDRVLHDGAVCLVLWGDIEAQPLVAQGVRPIGPPMRITQAERSYVLQLDGRPAVATFQALVSTLSDAERGRLRRGATVGISPPGSDERRPGPNDFLVRNIIGMDAERGVIGIGAPARPGMWMSFMVRDAQAAAEELTELLAEARPAQAALLFSCLGRGEAFFGAPAHDSGLIRKKLGPLPIGGFFANGELGPLRGRTLLHAYTSSLALLRSRPWD